MKNKNLIIIGKNSFLGTNIFRSLKLNKKILISYDQFCKLDDKKISKFSYICNCAVKRNYKKKIYSVSNDLDALICKRIIKLNLKYIFLSSRKVYKPKFNLYEKDKTQPLDQYSKNKTITENYLKKKLNEKQKNYRIINNTFFDNYLKLVKKNKKVLFTDFFKDFITIDQLTKIFSKILIYDLKGTYNLSLGSKVYLSEIISWLNYHNINKEKFKAIRPNISKMKSDSFTLNNNKLCKKINFKPKKNKLKEYCLRLSKIIHKNSFN